MSGLSAPFYLRQPRSEGLYLALLRRYHPLQPRYLFILLLDGLFLRGTHFQTGGRHALPDAALLHKFAVALGQKRRHGLIDHVAETYAKISHLLVRPAGEEGIVTISDTTLSMIKK